MSLTETRSVGMGASLWYGNGSEGRMTVGSLLISRYRVQSVRRVKFSVHDLMYKEIAATNDIYFHDTDFDSVFLHYRVNEYD